MMLVPVVGAAATPVQAVDEKPAFSGVWDLTWQTEAGPVRKGHMEIVQTGTDLDLTIYGNSVIKARGKAAGQTLSVRGSRLLIAYTITGQVSGDVLTGTLRMLSRERPFKAERRRPQSKDARTH